MTAADRTTRRVSPDGRESASLAAFGSTTPDLDVTEPGECSWVAA